MTYKHLFEVVNKAALEMDGKKSEVVKRSSSPAAFRQDEAEKPKSRTLYLLNSCPANICYELLPVWKSQCTLYRSFHKKMFRLLSTHHIYLLVDGFFLKSFKDNHDCVGFIFQKPKPCLLCLDQSCVALSKFSHLKNRSVVVFLASHPYTATYNIYRILKISPFYASVLLLCA